MLFSNYENNVAFDDFDKAEVIADYFGQFMRKIVLVNVSLNAEVSKCLLIFSNQSCETDDWYTLSLDGIPNILL